MRICKECGRPNQDSALYCASCGAEFKEYTSNNKALEKYVKERVRVGHESESGVFKNAGPKLKALAKIIFIIGFIIGEIIGISSIAIGADSYDGEVLVIIGIVLVIVSPLIAWIGAIVLYAFGELCENVNKIRHATESKNNEKA